MIKIKIYIKLSLKISPLNPGKEILIAELNQLQFDGFIEKSDGLECYIPSNKWNNKVLDKSIGKKKIIQTVSNLQVRKEISVHDLSYLENYLPFLKKFGIENLN